MGEMEASVASMGELSWMSRSYSSSASDSAYAVPVLKLMFEAEAGQVVGGFEEEEEGEGDGRQGRRRSSSVDKIGSNLKRAEREKGAEVDVEGRSMVEDGVWVESREAWKSTRSSNGQRQWV